MCLVVFVSEAECDFQLNNAVGAAADGIRSAIQGAVSDFNGTMKTLFDGINAATKLIGKTFQPPTFSIPDLSSLQNVTLPTDFQNALTNLNNSLPTLSDLKSKIDDL